MVDQSALPTLNFPKLGIHTRMLTSNILQIAFTRHSREMLIKNPPETNQMLHQFTPRGPLMGMLEPVLEIKIQFLEAFCDPRLTVIQAHPKFSYIVVHCQLPHQIKEGLRLTVA
jgi:hypothetical protein